MLTARVSEVAEAISGEFDAFIETSGIEAILEAATSGCGFALVPVAQIAEVDAFSDMLARLMLHGQGADATVASVR